MSTGEFTLITDDAAFERFVDDSMGVEAYAIDTEFHRERSYFPRVCLLYTSPSPRDKRQSRMPSSA